MSAFASLLAASPNAPPVSDVFIWSGLLVVLVLIGGVVIALARRSLTKGTSTTHPGFTLQDFRLLHESRKITNEEFERAKEAIIGSVRRADDSPGDRGSSGQTMRTDNSGESASSRGSGTDGETQEGQENPPPA